jgi:hypothetical protein
MNLLKREPTGLLEQIKIIYPDQDLELIDSELQSDYCFGFGILIHLTKDSRPEIFNVVRELSKRMDGTTMGSYLEMLRVIKFVLGTENFRFKI